MTKKIILVMAIFLFCGCNNKYESYKHYDIRNYKDENIIYHSFDWNNNSSRYALIDITDANADVITIGIFYKVNLYDYILIDEFFIDGEKNEKCMFFDNKLYVIDLYDEFVEYTLSSDKITKKLLNFNFPVDFTRSNIQNVSEEYIYYLISTEKENAINGFDRKNVIVKCSLLNYKCYEE